MSFFTYNRNVHHYIITYDTGQKEIYFLCISTYVRKKKKTEPVTDDTIITIYILLFAFLFFLFVLPFLLFL